MSEVEVRPPEESARQGVEEFLLAKLGLGFVPEFNLIEDGDDGWAFWIEPDDTTSYVHHDLMIEWYGTGYDPNAAEGD